MPEAEKVEELWDEFLRGEINEAAAKPLLLWLQSNPAELATRRKEAALSASLDCLLGPKESSQRLVKSVLARIEGTRAGEGSGRFRKRVMESVKSSARSSQIAPAAAAQPSERSRVAKKRVAQRRTAANSFWPAAAAALVIGAIILALLTPKKTEPVATAPEIPKTVPAPVPLPAPVPVVVEAPPWATLALKQGGARVDSKPVTGMVALKSGNHVELQENSTAELRLADGTMLQLAELSKLDLQETAAGNRVTLKHGSTDVHAAKQEEGKQFIIATPHAKVRVVGTQYSVQAFERFSRVAVNTGKVDVTAIAQDATGAKSQLGEGEEILVNNRGLESVRQSAQQRVIDANNCELETFTDPGIKKSLSDTFRGMALARLTYNKPRHAIYGYCGITFPISAAPGEDTFDVWIRPRWIKPEKEEFKLMKVAMLAQLGSTEYRIGAIEFYAGENDWVCLRGKISAATLHWVEPGTKQLPLREDLIQHIALRTEIGEIEYDHTGIIVWPHPARK